MSLIVAIAVGLVVLVVTLVWWHSRAVSAQQADGAGRETAARKAHSSDRKGRAAPPVDDRDSDDAEEEHENGGGDGKRGGAAREPKLSRLQRKKLEKEKEKAERRQAQVVALEARQRTLEEEDRKEEVAAKEAERAALEEAALQELREEKKRQDDEEYARWVGTMGVEESGELGDEQRKRHESMVTYLTERYATVRRYAHARLDREKEEGGHGEPLDDSARAALIASHQVILYDAAKTLGVTVEQLVIVIEQLVREEVVTGVFDEHGKFVLIAEEHYPLIAKFIQQRGRVSVTEIARECNQIILQC